MTFKFNLEKILSLVRMRETMKKMEVASIVQRVRFLKSRKKAVEEGIRSTLELTQSGESPQWYAFYTSKVELDVEEIRRLEGHLIEENKMLTQRQQELKVLLLKKKSLESLREKRFKDFRIDQSRKLQKQLDEIYQLTGPGDT